VFLCLSPSSPFLKKIYFQPILRKAVVLLALDALKSTLVVLSYYRNKEE
jgi:hypothetical protein